MKKFAPFINSTSLLRGSLAAGLACGLTACSSVPSTNMGHSPQFEPVYPIASGPAKPATGAIYVGRQSDSWFGKSKSFQVGDVITVLLNESSHATRTQNGSITR